MKINLLFVFLFIVSVSRAESAIPKSGEQVHDFAGLDCKVSWTTPKNSLNPVYNLRCEKFGKRTFSIKDFGGDKLYPSVDGRFLLALSNNGHHKYAYWIVNRVGEQITKKEHADKSIHYCKSTTSMARNWADTESAPVFEIVEGNLKSVFVKTCDGKTINLISALQ